MLADMRKLLYDRFVQPRLDYLQRDQHCLTKTGQYLGW